MRSRTDISFIALRHIPLQSCSIYVHTNIFCDKVITFTNDKRFGLIVTELRVRKGSL
jgi:hypothetical protein